MVTVHDAFQILRHRLVHECTKIRDIRDEKEKLYSAYIQYVDLSHDLDRRIEQTHRINALLGPDHFMQVMRSDETEVVGTQLEISPSPGQLREELVLWEAIEQYLLCVEEGSIDDMQDFFAFLGLGKVTRQAVESALKAHSKLFRIRKKGSSKYISLKSKRHN